MLRKGQACGSVGLLHHFILGLFLLAVGWYLRFSLSYRDVEELLAERGLLVDHVTVWRWVQRYAPEIQRRGQEEHPTSLSRATYKVVTLPPGTPGLKVPV
jgi:transposase-like protein